MTQDGFKRKLTAILSADVKGYSLLMADDEFHTIQTLKTYRRLMSDLIGQHSGRVVDNPGDNLLAEFSSAVDAVECAVQIQGMLKKENAKFVANKRLQFRIGINIGDVVQDGDRIYGSGVNVAARIEGLAEPTGICISRNTYDHVKDKLDLGFDYLGEHEVKNIKEPVRVYKVLLDADSQKPLVDEQLKLPDKPSIAVLPFDNMSGNPNQEYFSDGLTEQIINGLCKVSNLFVIARNSSFAYKGKSISVKQIAKELGVRYILEGSVQRAGERVRITAQLIDATTDYHMWSENYDRNLEDIFALQDEITGKLINAMEVKLISGEQARLWEGGTTNIQALDKINRGMESFNRFNQHDNAQARLFFKEASILDELSAVIYALIGLTHFFDLLYNWSDSPAESFVEAEKNANKALALNASLDLPHMLLGFVHLIKKEYDKAIIEAKQAVSLNPNGAYALSVLGYITCLTGDPKKGITLTKKAIRLNPIPPSRDYHILGLAYRLAGQYEKAIEVLNHSLKIDPAALTPYITLASCYMELNQFENARKAANKVLEIDPHFSLEYHQVTLPVKDQTLLNKHIDALRKAGLPD
jgi:adenylate cyclase